MQCPECKKHVPMEDAKLCPYCGHTFNFDRATDYTLTKQMEKLGEQWNEPQNRWVRLVEVLGMVLLVFVGAFYFLEESATPNDQPNAQVSQVQKSELGSFSQADLSIAKIVLGVTTANEMLSTLGQPEKVNEVIEYDVKIGETYAFNGLKAEVDEKTRKVVLMDISTPDYSTNKGLKVGDPGAKVIELYGKPTKESQLMNKKVYTYYIAGSLNRGNIFVDAQDKVERILFSTKMSGY